MTQPADLLHKKCLLCGQCLAACPVFLATGREELSPKAKQHTLRTLAAEPQNLALAPVRTLADLCLSCGRCAKACPSGLSVPAALGLLRAEHPLWHQWLWERWVLHGRILWPVMARLAPLVPSGMPPETMRNLVRSAATMLAGPREPAWIKAENFGTGAGRRPAMLFAGCTAQRIRPRWRTTARAILERLGYTLVDDTALTCCGATLEHAGIPKRAAEARLRNVTAWRKAGRPPLVTICASCHHGLSAYADDHDLGWGHGEQTLWREALVPLSSMWGETRFTLTDAMPDVLRYHQPCHWNGHDPDLAWLKRITGERLHTPGGVTCCGMGGVLQLASPELSATIASGCWQRLLPEEDNCGCPEIGTEPAHAGGASVVTGCSGCALQLASTAPHGASVRHWLDIIVLGD